MSDELLSQLVSMGLSVEEISRRLRNLRNRPLPKRGVFSLDVHVLEAGERWVEWARQDAPQVADADSRAGKAPSIDWPRGVRYRVQGWVPNAKAVAYAAANGLAILEEYTRFVDSGEPAELGLSERWKMDHAVGKVERAFARHLVRRAAEQAAERAQGAAA